MSYISFAYGSKHSSDYWNADGGTDNFFRIDGARRGFGRIYANAIDRFTRKDSACGFKLKGGSEVVLEFNSGKEMQEWLTREVKPVVPWIKL